jgi:DNA-binding Xre family transcriptional regulator
MRGHERLDVVNELGHAAMTKCENSHRQGVKFPHYALQHFACDTSHMNERDEIDRVKGSLKRLMEEKGIKAKPLSKKAGKGETFVRDLFEGDDVKVGNLHRLAEALDVTLADIIGGGHIIVAGRIGAGGEVIFEEVNDGVVPRPPGLSGPIEALEVEGSSMLPRYSSGDVVYIARTSGGVEKDDIGEFCAVRLKTGETYVKQLAVGSRPGFFTLRSLNAEDIVDVELEWATPIIFVMPRAARRRLGF